MPYFALVTPDELRPLVKDQDEEVRWAALQALGERATKEDLRPLLRDKVGYIHFNAFKAFARLIPPEELYPYFKDENPHVRAEAIRTLGQNAHPDELRPLLWDEDYLVRVAAIRALGERVTKDEIESLLWDDDSDVSWVAFRDYYVKNATLDEWRALLQDEELRFYAFRILEESDYNAKWVPLLYDELMRLLQGEDEGVRFGAICALNVRAPVEAVRPFLYAEWIMTRETARLILGDRIPVADLLQMFEDDPDGIGDSVITHLACHPDPEAREILVTLIKKGNNWAVSTLVRALRANFYQEADTDAPDANA